MKTRATDDKFAQRLSATVVALLLIAFAANAWLGVRGKSATADEPLHLMGAFMSTHCRDYRVDDRDPPLFHRWEAIALPRSALSVDLDSPKWKLIPSEHWHDWEFSAITLYRTPGNDADAALLRGRMMMLIAAVLGIGLVALWSGRIAGPLAAVVASALIAFDPNFLAHAALVKNDVALAFALLWVAYALWRIGDRITLLRTLNLILAVAVCVNVKFSGLLAGMLIPLLLLTRTFLDEAWRIGSSSVLSRWKRLLVASALTITLVLTTYLSIWALYGFRFAPTPDPSVRLAMEPIVEQAAERQLQINHPNRRATSDELRQWRVPLFVRGILQAERLRLLPQAWLHGLLYTYQSTFSYPAFLLGDYSRTGWWYYFPLAILFKTPLATLLILLTALILALINIRRAARWTAVCLSLPLILYGYNALTTNTNLGIRHILPVFPLLYVAAGALAGELMHKHRWARYSVLLLLIGLAAESLSAFPNYIPFFNAIAHPHRLALLSDSNLDWGQDLKLLADWQRRNPDQTLYLSYFGMTDPAYYGIRYTPLPGNFILDGSPAPAHEAPSDPGVVAISATNLQGPFLSRDARKFYGSYRARKPREILGGSIYLYDHPR